MEMIMEASYIKLLKPTSNEQKQFEILTLFRNCVNFFNSYIPKYDKFITY